MGEYAFYRGVVLCRLEAKSVSAGISGSGHTVISFPEISGHHEIENDGLLCHHERREDLSHLPGHLQDKSVAGDFEFFIK